MKIRRKIILIYLKTKTYLEKRKIRRLEKNYGVKKEDFKNIDKELWSDFI